MLYINYLANIENTPEGVKKYIIVRIPPKHFNFYQHPDTKHKPQLSPSKELLMASKNGELSFERFKERFLQEIHVRTDMKQAINELVAELNKGEDICLICYEKDSNDCHRKILADYIKEMYGLDYIDIKKEKHPYRQLSIWDFA